MKRIAFALATGLLCGQALAADLPMPAPPLGRRLPTYRSLRHSVGPASILVETLAPRGIGVPCRTPLAIGFTLPSNNAVFTGGGQVGGNWQINALVLGVEGQFDWLANQNNASAGIIAYLTATTPLRGSPTDRWLTTLTGRIGVAADHWLFYAKGGGAWVGNQSFTVNDVTTGAVFQHFQWRLEHWVDGGRRH